MVTATTPNAIVVATDIAIITETLRTFLLRLDLITQIPPPVGLPLEFGFITIVLGITMGQETFTHDPHRLAFSFE
jgi:hypothetical protein